MSRHKSVWSRCLVLDTQYSVLVGGVHQNYPQTPRTQEMTHFCSPNVWRGPIEGVQRGQVGTFRVILPYAVLSTGHTPTSQIGFSVYQGPSHQIPAGNVVTGQCGPFDHASCRSNTSGTLLVATNNRIRSLQSYPCPPYWNLQIIRLGLICTSK